MNANVTTEKQIKALFRYCGSKAKITKNLFEKFKETENYVDAFLGSGVVLFRVLKEDKYKKYIVNDINAAIINLYKMVQSNPQLLINTLQEKCEEYNCLESMEEKIAYFTSYKKIYNNNKKDWVSFWIIMAAGFNGLYRENRKGEFNVGSGKKIKITIDENHVMLLHSLIQNVEFYNLDYHEFYEMLEQKSLLTNKTFIYNDPPYTKNIFNYTSGGFDNNTLASFLKKINSYIAISDVDSEDSRIVYKEFYQTQIQAVQRAVQLSNRIIKQEVIYTNYITNGSVTHSY